LHNCTKGTKGSLSPKNEGNKCLNNEVNSFHLYSSTESDSDDMSTQISRGKFKSQILPVSKFDTGSGKEISSDDPAKLLDEKGLISAHLNRGNSYSNRKRVRATEIPGSGRNSTVENCEDDTYQLSIDFDDEVRPSLAITAQRDNLDHVFQFENEACFKIPASAARYLKDYQLFGVEWLLRKYCDRQGCILVRSTLLLFVEFLYLTLLYRVTIWGWVKLFR